MEHLLTIITRTCKRPMGLIRNIQSVQAQTCGDWEQIFCVDRLGKHSEGNILWANKQFELNAHRVTGDYVFPLDDDGMLIDYTFFQAIKDTVIAWNFPEVILVRTLSPSKKDGQGVRVLPENSMWKIEWEAGARPARWAGNGYCLVTRADIWRANVSAYHSHNEQTGGDWHYCTSLIKSGAQFVRLNVCASRSMGRGRGKIFEKCPADWFERVAAQVGIREIAPGDWRLYG